MKKIFLIPNMITAFGLACGLFVIFKVNMIEPGSGYYEVMVKSALLLLLAAFADFVDGAVARAFRAESEFGFMFDSLADSISFGVAPSVLILKSLSVEQGSVISFMIASGAMIYSLCGVLRLVRFNIQSRKSEEDIIEMNALHKHFTGLPIPAAAAAAVSANLLLLSPFFDRFSFSLEMRAIILTVALVILGYFMLSRLKFPSLKALHFKVPSFHLAFLSVLVAVVFLYGILYFFPIVLAIVSWGYFVVALILSTIRLIAGKKSKTLIDFEPEKDDFE
ncbi:MAG TPA: CDP-alcohol phosphatidyltransferase family protein [Chlamydiales bacterium]|nr:CDP-alcohol phosphatidyltransferase family protein [Chlamydiales bacterium]